jgi:hypothetical protein
MKKYLPYIIIGVPLLLGGFLLAKAMKKDENIDEPKPDDINKPEDVFAPTPSTGGTFVETGTSSSPSTGAGSSTPDFPLRVGSRSEYVRVVQQKLGGLVTDGIFGSKTEARVKEFQKANNLTQDGIVGNLTWKAIFGVDFPKTSLTSGNLGGMPNAPFSTTKFPVSNSAFGL